MNSKTSKLTPAAASATPARANSSRSKSELGAPGVIEPGCLFTVPEVRARLGLGSWAWRTLRRAGPADDPGRRAGIRPERRSDRPFPPGGGGT